MNKQQMRFSEWYSRLTFDIDIGQQNTAKTKNSVEVLNETEKAEGKQQIFLNQYQCHWSIIIQIKTK